MYRRQRLGHSRRVYASRLTVLGTGFYRNVTGVTGRDATSFRAYQRYPLGPYAYIYATAYQAWYVSCVVCVVCACVCVCGGGRGGRGNFYVACTERSRELAI